MIPSHFIDPIVFETMLTPRQLIFQSSSGRDRTDKITNQSTHLKDVI